MPDSGSSSRRKPAINLNDLASQIAKSSRIALADGKSLSNTFHSAILGLDIFLLEFQRRGYGCDQAFVTTVSRFFNFATDWNRGVGSGA